MFKRGFWTRTSTWVYGDKEFYPMWKDEEVITEKKFEKSLIRQSELEEKLNLILDHLKLSYVPETETTEPAKLEKRLTVDNENINKFIEQIEESIKTSAYNPVIYMPKKKRKYVKSGKYKKS